MAPKKAPIIRKKPDIEKVNEDGFFPSASSVTPEELEETIQEYDIPRLMVQRPIPGTNGPGLMHTPPGSCFTLPLFALRAGLSLPFSPDQTQIFHYIGLPLCQLTFNAHLLINSYLIISRWFNWPDAARNFTHLFSVVQYRPNKWEYSLKFKSSVFIKIPNNPHPGRKSKFVYIAPPANYPFAPVSNWTRGKVEMIPCGEKTIPPRDLGKLEILQWDAESLSVRDTLRAAGLVFPFDHNWSNEERSRRRSYLGNQMAFRALAGAKKRSQLKKQRDAEFEADPTVQFQREVLRETDEIDRSLPARENVLDPTFDIPQADLSQREQRPESSRPEPSRPDSPRPESPPRPDSQRPESPPLPESPRPESPQRPESSEDNSSSQPPSPPKKKQKQGYKKHIHPALNKLKGTGRRIFVIDSSESPSDDATDAQGDASLDSQEADQEISQPPPVDLNQEPPSTEIPQDEVVRKELPTEPLTETRVETEASVETEIPPIQTERSGEDVHQEEVVRTSTIPTPASSSSRSEGAVQTETLSEQRPDPEPEQNQRRRRRGKRVLHEYDEDMARRCDAQSGPQIPSGPGQSSGTAIPGVDPSTGMPPNWPFDIPRVGGIAAYDHRGFFGFHPFPMPTAEEIQRQLSSEDPCLLTLMHPQQCTDRDLAVLLDTVTKMNLSVGQEIFYRHRYHGQRVEDAMATGLRRGERRNREAREIAAARIQSLETEISRLQGELTAITNDFNSLVQSSNSSEAKLKESLAKAQEELDCVKFELSNAQLFLTANQDMRRALETQVTELRSQLDSSEIHLETVQNEANSAKNTVDELSEQIRAQAVEIDHLRGEVDRLQTDIQTHETEYLESKEALTAQLGQVHLETNRSLAQVREEAARSVALAQENESKAQEDAAKAREEATKAKEDATAVREELAKLREESAQSIARSRLEGARDFRGSAVFRSLTVRLAYPLASQLWDNSISQTSYLGGYKEDFDPNILLDIEKDGEFREYAEEAGLEIDPSDEFVSLQYNAEEDANIIPLGLPESAPQPPQYPPPKP